MAIRHRIISTTKRNNLLFIIFTINERVHKSIENVKAAPILSMDDYILSGLGWFDKLVCEFINKVSLICGTSKNSLNLFIKRTF